MVEQGEVVTKRVVVASLNPVKAKATLNGFRRMFPSENVEIEPLAPPRDAPVQPLSDEETLQGALSRAQSAADRAPDADLWVGIEGGVGHLGGEMTAFAWVVVMGKDLVGKARTGTFFLPPQVAKLVSEGRELGEADDIVFGRANSKQENGAVGLLTGDVIDRVKLYEHAVVLALVPFKNAGMYADE